MLYIGILFNVVMSLFCIYMHYSLSILEKRVVDTHCIPECL